MTPSLLFTLLLAVPVLLTPLTSQELEVRGQRTPRDTKQDFIKVLISEGCSTQGDSSDVSQEGKEIDLSPGSPLVLTHKIKLVPSGSGSGSGSCGCEADFAALRERLERLEREVSALREKCGGAEGGCCTSKESKGAGCSIKPDVGQCPNECSDQGRCVDGKCVCFTGFSGPDCSASDCPGNCNDKGKCVNGQCVCDPGFTGPDCSQGACPDNCNNRGRCVNGKCVCDSGFTGPSCSDESCPGNCKNRGRCVNGKCVCNPGFTGPDCSKRGCPGNCNNQGRCVNGRCVCNSGFSGADCSETSCPGNCNKRGRCVDGECVCDEGFGGPDCLEITCPNDCYDRGRCVNGQCVCDTGFTGEDCSETACPGNCNNRGRCVNGQCVCDDGFTGDDCSERSCPGNCNNRGRCVNGQCVCHDGYTGADCSEDSCPGNCNNRGRCVNGQCVCDDGFTGNDCSERSCPGNCNNRGRCVNGQCVCDDGFTGNDCSERSCPGNCNNRGRCVNGQCVCNDGFTGADCSEKSCPNNCSNRGKCVNGKCVCDVGFAGPDCGAKGCPNNCSNKGRCVKGKCVCRRGFTGPDCSQCEEGMTGPNCDTAMSGVSQLSTRDVTETSVTLVWTPPPVQYETYHITFTSQKESDQQISVTMEGSLTTYTQTGLATGQEYTVSITGEINGRRGAESTADFMTLLSGPSNLQVVKKTTTSAVVQWEQSQGEIDRYRLTVTPNDRIGRSQEMTVPAGQDSAHIQQLEAGRLYDITLVAEKGSSQSNPASTQVTPGKPLPRASGAALTMPVTLAPGQDGDDRNPSSAKEVFDDQGRRVTVKDSVKPRGEDRSNKDSKATVIARTKPLPNKKVATDGSRPKVAEKPALPKKPIKQGPFRFNTTRVVPGGKKTGPGPIKKPPVGNQKTPILAKKPKPGGPIKGNRTTALKVRDPSVAASRSETTNAQNPTLVSGIDSDTKRQSSSEGPTFSVGSKEQPDVGKVGQGNDTGSVSSEPTGIVQSQEKKCLNKIKVTHIRLPHKDRSNGCKGGVKFLAGKTPGLHQDSSETDDSADLDYTPDPLHQVIADKFKKMNVTTFFFHVSKPSDLSVDADTVREKILGGFKPASSIKSSASPNSQSPSHDLPYLSPSSDSSSSSSSKAELSSHPISSPSSLPSPSPLTPSPPSSLPLSSPSPLTPSLPSSLPLSSPSPLTPSHPSSLPLSLPSPPSSLPLSSPLPSSSSISSSDESESSESKEPDVDDGKRKISITPHEDRRQPSPGKDGLPFFRRTLNKPGFIRRPHPNLRPNQNKTHQNWRVSHPSSTRLSPSSRIETETSSISTDEISSPSSSEKPASVKVNTPVRNPTKDHDVASTPLSSGVKQNNQRFPAENGRVPVRRLQPKGGFPRRQFPNFGPFQNRTHPHLRLRPSPARPLKPASETRIEQLPSTKFPATLSPSISKGPHLSEQTGPIGEENKDRVRTKVTITGLSTEFNETPRGNGETSSTELSQTPGGIGQPSSTELNQTPGGIGQPSSTELNQTPGGIGQPSSTELNQTPGGIGQPSSTEFNQTPRGNGETPSTEFNQTPGGIRQLSTNEFNQTLRGNGEPSSRRPATHVGPFRRPVYGGRFQNRTHTILRPPQHPFKGPIRKPFPTRMQNASRSITPISQTNRKDSTDEITENQLAGQDDSMPTRGVQNKQPGEQGTTEAIPSAEMHVGDTTDKPETNNLEERETSPIQSVGEETVTQTPDSDTKEVRITDGDTRQGGPTIKKPDPTYPGQRKRPVTLPNRKPPTRGTTAQQNPQIKRYLSGGQRRDNAKTNTTAKGGLKSKTKQSGGAGSKPPTALNVSPTGITREPLDRVEVTNRTSEGFKLVWDSPEGKYKNFVVTRTEVEKDKRPKQTDSEREQEDKDGDDGKEVKHPTTKETESENGRSEDENKVPENFFTQSPRHQSSTTAKPLTGGDKTFKQVVPGSARSFQFDKLPPQTEYTVTLLGKGPGILSRLHKLVISTGPEPPTDIVFSELTDNSLTVSWTKPRTSISGFKVTYTHKEEGEPVSVSVDSKDSTVSLSRLSPGSTYEVSIISLLGLDESDPLKDFTTTLPDAPTDLRAVNVTDSTALLLWRPALAAVDTYAIVYGSGTDSELRISVSGNAAEQLLTGLEGSTTYTVTITSQLGSLKSSEATTTFTTTRGSGGAGEGPRDLTASNVTPRTALLQWTPPAKPVSSYKLTYQTEDGDMKELVVDGALTEYNLIRLFPGSKYTVLLQAMVGGQYTAAISTEFTTGSLRFPFPTDCSQELQNGIRISGEVEIFPKGKLGPPIMVYCDMETDGGGWTVFQRRKDGSVDFFRGWKDYMKGFGDLSGEFWLGLDNLVNLTSMTRMTLRVDLRDKDESVYAKYSTFEVVKRNYKLTVGGYSGTAGDSLSYHNNRLFSTKDRDPMPFITRCAMSYRGGWWYKNCHEANLNGLYGIDVKHQGIIWTSWKGKEHSIPFTEMKMRPADFRG